MLRRRWPLLALIAWTAYVWVTRIVNTWSDPAAALATQVGATVVSVALLGLAGAALAAAVRHRAEPLPAAARRLVAVLCWGTVGVWVVRGVQIVLADYGDADPTSPAFTNPAGFKAVHLVLGAVSIVLAGLTWRAVARERDEAPEAVSPPAPAHR